MSINTKISFFRNVMKALDQYKTNQEHPDRQEPNEMEIWITRNGRHHVLILLKDPLRVVPDYPITGVVLYPDDGGAFTDAQRVKYPRFTRSGQFSYTQTEHHLDLVRRIG